MKQMEQQDLKTIISKMVDRLREQYQPEKIILYGSYAYGNPDEGSDIDLLIIKDTDDRPVDRRIMVRKMISDIRNKIPFSSLVLTPREISHVLAMDDDFFTEITNKGLVLYER